MAATTSEQHGPSDSRISETAEQIYRQVVDRLGDAWANRLSDAERGLIIDCCNDAAVLSIDALAGRTNVDKDFRHVNAQLANIKSLGETRVAAIFWRAAKDVVLNVVFKLAAVAAL
jgi:hypothetical protein